MDAKKSPLALLAQTCSQIGADTAAIKPTSGSMDKAKKPETSKSPSTISKTPRSNTSPQETRPLAFKPYESNVLTRSTDERPSSKASSTNGSIYDEKQQNYHQQHHHHHHQQQQQQQQHKQSARVPSRSKSNCSPIELSAVNNNNNNNHSNSRETKSENGGSAGKHTPSSERKSPTSPPSSHRDTSPQIRSGLEVLQGHSSKDLSMNGAFKPNSYALNPLAALCCPPGMEQHTNPAFRPPFANGFAHHHAAMLAAAAAYPPNTPNPYISYQRIKTQSGGETIVPICKDPYCTGCQFSQHNQQMLLGIPCPAGCTQCEQQKYGLAMAAMSGLSPNNPYAQMDRPYMCSWVVSDGYCGKRCASTEELMQHLRSHTPNLSDPTATAVMMQAQQRAFASMHPLGSLFSAAAAASPMHRGYPAGPQLSPLSSATRFHPYAKPGPATSATLPYATFNPSALTNPYYAPYALYSQRLNAAAAAAINQP